MSNEKVVGLDHHLPHQLAALREALGEPVAFEFGEITDFNDAPRRGYRFSCGCEAVQVQGDGLYVISVPCSVHQTDESDTIRISRRRCPTLSMLHFTYDAKGLLTSLIGAQKAGPSEGGGADVLHEPDDFAGHEGSLRQLIDAGIIAQRPDGRYGLLLFNRWDPATGEWY